MSTEMATGQYRQRVPTSGAYYDDQDNDAEGYYANQPYYPSHDNEALRYTSQGDHTPMTTTSSYDTQNTTLPYHSRNQSAVHDQYDGPPIIPARTTSNQPNSPHTRSPVAPSTAPLDARVAAARHARQNVPESQAGQVYNRVGDYHDEARGSPREDTSGAARSRRKGPASPDSAPRATSTRDRSSHSVPSQSRSEVAMSAAAPPPITREYSEVLNRVVVSDPQEDVERAQERVAESHPAPLGLDPRNVPALDDDILPPPGPARRQDYSKTARRKDVQFGDYVLGQTLGEGEFGKVKLGWKKDGSSQVAIKLIRRESVASNPTRLPKIYREISILRELAHPNIVRLHEMVETERHIGIILEYASGGELFDYILNHRYLKDPAARRLFAQLISGVGYLHKKGIVHRDLKLENLLLDQNRNIIITDFGFANTFDPSDDLSDEVEYNLSNKEFVRKFKLDRLDARGMRRGDLMQTSCGSPCYAAPELVVSDSLYTGKKVDVWSCGVILYAMLAGYLPFDDDPANPEGDNINLLYKYITTTPLTFPEYVTPHARDLLRRILVPDPRKRADLFEVARHSWLSEYHHIVSHITSSTTNVAEISNTTVPSEEEERPMVNRSASVRDVTSKPTRASPGALVHTGRGHEADEDSTDSRRTRHTLQPEYVAPSTHTARGQALEPIMSRSHDAPQVVIPSQPASTSKPLPQDPPRTAPKERQPIAAQQQKMYPPVRPGRDIPRSVSDSTSAFGQIPTSQGGQYATRPSTQGSMASTGGPPVRPELGLRLPSRGSYAQPAAPTVAATNVQGRVTQPTKSSRGYNISGPIPQPGAQNSIGQPMTSPMPAAEAPAPQKNNHHRRSSTLSGLGERLFGRSNSVVKKDKDVDRQKNGRRYPPTAMKEYPSEPQPRMSTDSKRSFSFGLGKKKSTDLDNTQGEKPVRRFSLIPSSMSIKNLLGSAKEDSSKPGTPRTDQYPQQNSPRPAPAQEYSEPVSNSDGQYDDSRPVRQNYSRPPQAPYSAAPAHMATTQPSNDVYGSTAVYAPNGQSSHQRQRSEPMAQMISRQELSAAQQGRPSMQQGRREGRGVLVKNNRKFTEGYAQEQGPTHHGGRSGAVKKVQDFFRRRRATNDGDYR